MSVARLIIGLAASTSLLGFRWNPSDKNANVTLSSGDLKAASSAAALSSVRGTVSKSSGKWYYEAEVTASPITTSNFIGVATAAQSIADNHFVGEDGAKSVGWEGTGAIWNGSSTGGAYPGYTTGDVIGVYYNAATGDVWFAKNGVVVTGDPVAGTGGTAGPSGAFPACTLADNDAFTLRDPQTIPVGYAAW